MDKNKYIIKVYSDGAAKGNPDGPGGYGAVVKYFDKEGKLIKTEEFTEFFETTTNNRMELLGAITAMESIMTPSSITLYSDSKYIIDAFNKMWLLNWSNNDWKKVDGSSVKNQDLWKRLLKAVEPHNMVYMWVKGHAGHEENERCDFLATASASGVKFKKKDDGTLEQIVETTWEDNKACETNPPITYDKDCYRIIIAGSRNFTNYDLVKESLDPFIKSIEGSKFEIISGMAEGADLLGERYAMEHNYPLRRFPAKWAVYGKSAGFKRNEEMVSYASYGKGILFAFWDGESKGTKHTIDLSIENNFKLTVVKF